MRWEVEVMALRYLAQDQRFVGGAQIWLWHGRVRVRVNGLSLRRKVG